MASNGVVFVPKRAAPKNPSGGDTVPGTLALRAKAIPGLHQHPPQILMELQHLLLVTQLAQEAVILLQHLAFTRQHQLAIQHLWAIQGHQLAAIIRH
jgi:hypothetical protein